MIDKHFLLLALVLVTVSTAPHGLDRALAIDAARELKKNKNDKEGLEVRHVFGKDTNICFLFSTRLGWGYNRNRFMIELTAVQRIEVAREI